MEGRKMEALSLDTGHTFNMIGSPHVLVCSRKLYGGLISNGISGWSESISTCHVLNWEVSSDISLQLHSER
jgi:hypothetical protein